MTHHYWTCRCPPCLERRAAVQANYSRFQPCPTCGAATGQRCTNRRFRDRICAWPHVERRVIRPALPPSHMRVLRLIGEGMTSKAVAASLGIRKDTVDCTVKRIRTRLGAYDRIHAVQLAQAKGIL